MGSAKKYLIISIVLISVGFLGLTLGGTLVNYKYGSISEYDCRAGLSERAGQMSGYGYMMNMMNQSGFQTMIPGRYPVYLTR